MSRVIALFAALLSLAAGCRRDATPAPPPAASTKEGTAAGSGEAGEHAHGRKEAAESDLDQSADALLSKRCEHGKKTFECDECRYEVGVARVPRSMIDEGLVKTAMVARRKLEAPIQLTGEIKFDERRVTHIAPSSEAMVRTVKVSLGQRVRAGDALIVLESIALGEAQSQYLESRGALELARKAAERAESLREERIASEKEWLQARRERDASEIRAKAAAEKLERLGLSPSEVEGLASRGGTAGRGTFVLRAPAAGIVLEMHAVPGELVRPDEAILTVGDLSDLWILADLYEDQLGRVL
jgi:cobalt-zinc-cadmium efflux system membrane fusion protein